MCIFSLQPFCCILSSPVSIIWICRCIVAVFCLVNCCIPRLGHEINVWRRIFLAGEITQVLPCMDLVCLWQCFTAYILFWQPNILGQMFKCFIFILADNSYAQVTLLSWTNIFQMFNFCSICQLPFLGQMFWGEDAAALGKSTQAHVRFLKRPSCPSSWVSILLFKKLVQTNYMFHFLLCTGSGFSHRWYVSQTQKPILFLHHKKRINYY